MKALDFNDLGAAEKELEQLAAEWQSAHRENPSAEAAENLALTLQTLGIVERQAGKPDEALVHLEKACELLEAHAPGLLVDGLEVKALTLQDLGKLEESGDLLRKVVETRESNTATSDQVALSASLDHLALNLLYQGHYAEVGPLIDKAIVAIGTDDDPDGLAQLLGHRGRLHHTLGSHSRAIDDFREALRLPFDNPEMRLTLESQIALAQLRLGKIEEARSGTDEVAKAAREYFATDSIRAVPYINNSGEMALSLGEYAEARARFQEVVEILEAALGGHHAQLIGPLNNLGVTEQAMGDYAEAKVHLERAAELQSEHLPAIHLRVAETERNLARNSLLSEAPDAKKHVARATKLGLDLLDQLISNGSEKERLNFLERFDLVSLPCATGDAELIADVLLASKARLLDTMLSEATPAGSVKWQDIQSSLEKGTAFIDTCRYFTIETSAEESYGAILILPEGPPKWIPLGSAADLQGWMDAFRKRLVWRSSSSGGASGPPPPLKTRGVLRALHQNFWQPIAEFLPPETQHIAYSPAGMLHFMPLAALMAPDGRTLSNTYLQVTTVGSGRDLLNHASAGGLMDRAWSVLTVSDFPDAKESESEDPLLDLLYHLQPMPGTQDEASRLKRIAPVGSLFLTDKESTEETLHHLPNSPSVLHLGSHAFFLDDPNASSEYPVDFDERSDLLFSSGLVLYHGTQRTLDSSRLSDSDDLLFPSEIAQLPLQGTRLVTLSSCESGAGTPVSGEGVLGLRRAFSLAGAQEVVVALWPVSDVSTPTFMEHFYRRAAASDRPAQALWQTQGDFLAAATSEDEFELAVLRFAPFVLSQSSALVSGPSLPSSDIPKTSSLSTSPRRYLLAVIPLMIFLLARLTKSSPEQSS